ncbi:MAG: hypothetical protein WCT04_08560 [Planctomycetota bacterium]
MKKIFAALCMLFALGLCTSSMAADAKKEEKKEDKKMKKEAPADGSTITVTGMMAVKATGAKSDVVCRITTGRQKNDPLYNLIASGDLASQIEKFRQEGDKVKVVGVINGENLTVKSVEKQVYMKK